MFTWSGKQHGILRVLCAQFLHGLVHWDKSSVGDRARKDALGRDITFAKDKLACDAMNAVCANHGIRLGGRTVLEAEFNATVIDLLNGLQTFVEMCTLSGDAFDEFVEEMRAVDALDASLGLLVTDNFTLALAFTLTEE